GPTTRACTSGANVGRACTTLGNTCPSNTGVPNSAPCADVANACGDGDPFGDPGERVRVTLGLQNLSGFSLTGVSLSLSTADPDIACILDANISIPSFPDGAMISTNTLSPGDDPANPTDGRFFELVISPTATTTNPASPTRAIMTMTLNSNEAGG